MIKISKNQPNNFFSFFVGEKQPKVLAGAARYVLGFLTRQI